MKVHHKVLVFLLLIAFCFGTTNKSIAQSGSQKQPIRILFDFDASQSMWGQLNGQSKIVIARRVMKKVMDSLKTYKNIQLALRLFGSQYPVNTVGQNCQDTKLAVPFGPNNNDKITKTLDNTYPQGTTLIAYSLEKCGNDFPDRNAKNIIILITDGIEECNGDPCAVSRALQSKGVTLKPFIIGLGIDKDLAKSLKCVGNYYGATDESSFQRILGVVISQVMNQTSVQVNLLDAGGDATETNVAMTFYDTYSKQVKYNFMHTMNARGVPDTIPIDPLYKYNLVVHTIPEVEKDSITLKPGIKNIIAVDAPQGQLQIKCDGLEYKNIETIVRQDNKMKTLNIQPIGRIIPYIVGKYDLEILTLPRLYVNDVQISQSHLTKVQIPQPGQLSLSLPSQGYGSIYKINGEQLQWVCNLLENTDGQVFKLLPGDYEVIFRSINATKVILTKTKEFTISSGNSTQINFE